MSSTVGDGLQKRSEAKRQGRTTVVDMIQKNESGSAKLNPGSAGILPASSQTGIAGRDACAPRDCRLCLFYLTTEKTLERVTQLNAAGAIATVVEVSPVEKGVRHIARALRRIPCEIRMIEDVEELNTNL